MTRATSVYEDDFFLYRGHFELVAEEPDFPTFNSDRFYTDFKPFRSGTVVVDTGPDARLLKARVTALKAEIAMAQGDLKGAKKRMEEALSTAMEYKKSKVERAGFSLILARILMKEGDYSDAARLLRRYAPKEEWRTAHAEAMASVRAGKINDAIVVFKRAIDKLIMNETGEGLSFAPPRTLREREKLYEDFLGVLVKAVRESKLTEHLDTAWEIAQKLKMRRILYDLSSVGCHGFPEVPGEFIERFKAARFAYSNGKRRKSFESRPKVIEQAGAADWIVDAKYPAAEIDALLSEMDRVYPSFRSFLAAGAPTIRDIQDHLAQDEIYAAFIYTDTSVYRFLITKDSAESATTGIPCGEQISIIASKSALWP
jgi:hypothetical protein